MICFPSDEKANVKDTVQLGIFVKGSREKIKEKQVSFSDFDLH